MSTTRALSGLVFFFFLGGCGLLSKTQPPVFHVLTSTAVAGAETLDTTIGVGPVRVTAFLTNQRIATHAGGGTINFDDQQRWGETLGEGVQRVMLQNLRVVTGAQTLNFPWRQTTIPHYAVRIDVIDLDELPGGQALLEVAWVLEDLRAAGSVKSEQLKLLGPLNGSGITALVSAYSELLGQLAGKIGNAVTSQVASQAASQAASRAGE